MQTEDRKEALRRIDELNKEIRSLKAGLTELADRRDAIVERKSTVGREIVTLIRGVRQLKVERNALTDEVRALKVERDKLNTAIREKIEAVKVLNEERRQVEQKLNLKESPSRLKAQIERLEHSIETEALPFDKEQKIMKVIKDLRKKYDEAQKASGIWDKGHALSREIDELRAKADEVHRTIQQKSRASQERHELMLDSCRKIDDLRKKEEEIARELEPIKQELQPKDQQMQALLSQVRELSGQLKQEERAEAVATAQEQRKKLSDRQAEVQDKFKKGEKLTTEDLLVLQTLELKDEPAPEAAEQKQ